MSDDSKRISIQKDPILKDIIPYIRKVVRLHDEELVPAVIDIKSFWKGRQGIEFTRLLILLNDNIDKLNLTAEEKNNFRNIRVNVPELILDMDNEKLSDDERRSIKSNIRTFCYEFMEKPCKRLLKEFKEYDDLQSPMRLEDLKIIESGRSKKYDQTARYLNELIRRIDEHTYSLYEIYCAVRHVRGDDIAYLATDQQARAEEVKRKYNELINDLREEIADDVWNKKLSSIDQELSSELQKLITAFSNAQSRKDDVKKILEKIMELYHRLFQNVRTETILKYVGEGQ
jgi:uncharacterized Zn finger protein (UPF0148 family)